MGGEAITKRQLREKTNGKKFVLHDKKPASRLNPRISCSAHSNIYIYIHFGSYHFMYVVRSRITGMAQTP